MTRGRDILNDKGMLKRKDDIHLFASAAFGLTLDEASAKWEWPPKNGSRARTKLVKFFGAQNFMEALVRVFSEKRIKITELEAAYDTEYWWTAVDNLTLRSLSPRQVQFLISEIPKYPRGLEDRWNRDSISSTPRGIMRQAGLRPNGVRTYVTILAVAAHLDQLTWADLNRSVAQTMSRTMPDGTIVAVTGKPGTTVDFIYDGKWFCLEISELPAVTGSAE